MTRRITTVLACLALAGAAFAQMPPASPPIAPPPVLDPQSPPVQTDGAPIDAHDELGRAGDTARLQLDQARLQCQTMPEQQRQSCLDAAQRTHDQALRRDEDPVR